MCFDEDWEDEEVLTVLQMVYETTPRTDRGIRDEILQVYSRYTSTLMGNPRLISMLDADGQLACDILKMTKETLGAENETLTRALEWTTENSLRKKEAHKKEMQAKDDAHRQAIQFKDVASQQAMQSKDREYKSKVEEHRRAVQSKKEEFRKVLQAKDKTHETARSWAREEVRVFREVISKNAICRRCAKPLELTKPEPVIFGSIHTRANLECRHCLPQELATRVETKGVRVR